MIKDVEDLKAILSYDPAEGIFRWRIAPRGRLAGQKAGSLCNGYVRIQIGKVNYAAHRLAFLYMTGSWPDAEIDHINRNKSDNKWLNLRASTRSQNCINKGSENKGVHFIKKTGKYAAVIGKDGKRIRIGTFPSAELASEAYRNMAKDLYGEFAG